MKLKTFAIAALLVMGVASASAQRVKTYTSVFEPIASGELVALGFGRGGDVFSPTESAQMFRMASFSTLSTLSANTPGELPYTFHDIWKFTGLAAGTYSLDTVIKARDNTTFGLALFVWSDNGSLDSFEFNISLPDRKTAEGSGTFTVGPGCDVNYCVNMHIYGWDDGETGLVNGYFQETPFGVTVVPEPTTGAMLLAGLGALGWLARRRRA